MQTNPNQSSGEGDSILTIADVQHAMSACSQSPRDPLADYPVLQQTARSVCMALGFDLVRCGAAGELAAQVTNATYTMVAIAALAMRQAIWREVLEGRTDGAA